MPKQQYNYLEVLLPNAVDGALLALLAAPVPAGLPLVELSGALSRRAGGRGIWDRELVVPLRGASVRLTGVTKLEDDFTLPCLLEDTFLTRVTAVVSFRVLGKSCSKPSTLLLLKDKPSFTACCDNSDFLP